jgi:hypothetical protein
LSGFAIRSADRSRPSGMVAVIIFTRIPAPWHSATAANASGRGGSIRPTTPIRTSLPSNRRHQYRLSSGNGQVAKANTRCPARPYHGLCVPIGLVDRLSSSGFTALLQNIAITRAPVHP